MSLNIINYDSLDTLLGSYKHTSEGFIKHIKLSDKSKVFLLMDFRFRIFGFSYLPEGTYIVGEDNL